MQADAFKSGFIYFMTFFPVPLRKFAVSQIVLMMTPGSCDTWVRDCSAESWTSGINGP